MNSETVRPSAVAGTFYPAAEHELRIWLESALANACSDGLPPKAMIAPHAGYIYSGEVAATAYARLNNRRSPITRVVLLGPAHCVGFKGIAAPTVDSFETPLGDIPLDRAAIDQLLLLPGVVAYDLPHQQEHSLEVQLPFLQMVLGKFELIPLVVGGVEPQVVANVLNQLWGGDETLIVISSDLSHFHDYATAKRMDQQTSIAIEAGNESALDGDCACGYLPVRGLMLAASQKGLVAETIDLRNSGDTAGPRDRVVGYGAYAFNRK